MTSVLFDLNNLAIRTFFSKDINANTPHPDFQLWIYFLINSIYQSMFNVEGVNEIILAVDSSHSWRKIYFPRYKEDRSEKREKSDVNWDLFFKRFSLLQKDIKTYLPFKVLKVKNAEADDIIGVLCNNNKKNYVIISNDEDYTQCLKENVKVYNPTRKEYIRNIDTEDFLVKKSLLGQPKDCIFNIKTPIDYPKGKRKPGFGEKSLEKVMKMGYKKWLEDNDLLERFEINRNLIDFNRIPKTIKSRIINAYTSYELPEANNFYTFFKKHNLRSFLDDFERVELQLLNLY